MRLQLWIIAGPNGAVKTTLVSRRFAARVPVINPDDIAASIPRIDGRLDQRRAGILALQRRSALLQTRESLAIETTLTGHSALRFIAQARQARYKIALVFVGLSSPDLSIQRVEDRVDTGGHAVPVSALERRYPEALANLPIAMIAANRVFVLDNRARRRRLLLSADDGHIRYLARELPAWFRIAVPDVANTAPHDQ